MGRFIFRCLILSFLWSEKLPRQTPKWFLEPRAMEPWWQQCIRVANGKRGWGSTDVWSGVGLVGLVVGTEIFARQLQHTYPRNVTPDPKKPPCLFFWFHIMDMCNLWYIPGMFRGAADWNFLILNVERWMKLGGWLAGWLCWVALVWFVAWLLRLGWIGWVGFGCFVGWLG